MTLPWTHSHNARRVLGLGRVLPLKHRDLCGEAAFRERPSTTDVLALSAAAGVCIHSCYNRIGGAARRPQCALDGYCQQDTKMPIARTRHATRHKSLDRLL